MIFSKRKMWQNFDSAYNMTNNLINIFSSDWLFSKTNSRGHPFKQPITFSYYIPWYLSIRHLEKKYIVLSSISEINEISFARNVILEFIIDVKSFPKQLISVIALKLSGSILFRFPQCIRHCLEKWFVEKNYRIVALKRTFLQ
jgi:hypothetical protein